MRTKAVSELELTTALKPLGVDFTRPRFGSNDILINFEVFFIYL